MATIVLVCVVGLAVILVAVGTVLARRASKEPERLARLPEPTDEPSDMTVERHTSVGGVQLFVGERLKTWRTEGGIPKARRERVLALSGDTVIASPTEARALAVAIEDFAKDLRDERKPA